MGVSKADVPKVPKVCKAFQMSRLAGIARKCVYIPFQNMSIESCWIYDWSRLERGRQEVC